MDDEPAPYGYGDAPADQHEYNWQMAETLDSIHRALEKLGAVVADLQAKVAIMSARLDIVAQAPLPFGNYPPEPEPPKF